MFEYEVDKDTDLKLLEPCHAEMLFALVDANREYLRQWLPWLDENVAVSDSLDFIRATQKQLANNDGFVAGIWHRGELVGVVGHNRIGWEDRISYPGYWLGAQWQGRGIMTKACRALIDHAFAELKLNRVEIRCAVGNSRSRAIPVRLGLHEESVIRQAEWLYDKYVDHLVYSISVREWQLNNERSRASSRNVN